MHRSKAFMLALALCPLGGGGSAAAVVKHGASYRYAHFEPTPMWRSALALNGLKDIWGSREIYEHDQGLLIEFLEREVRRAHRVDPADASFDAAAQLLRDSLPLKEETQAGNDERRANAQALILKARARIREAARAEEKELLERARGVENYRQAKTLLHDMDDFMARFHAYLDPSHSYEIAARADRVAAAFVESFGSDVIRLMENGFVGYFASDHAPSPVEPVAAESGAAQAERPAARLSRPNASSWTIGDATYLRLPEGLFLQSGTGYVPVWKTRNEILEVYEHAGRLFVRGRRVIWAKGPGEAFSPFYTPPGVIQESGVVHGKHLAALVNQIVAFDDSPVGRVVIHWAPDGVSITGFAADGPGLLIKTDTGGYHSANVDALLRK